MIAPGEFRKSAAVAAIGAEHHRQFVGGLCNDGYRPIHRLTVVVVQVRQQLDYGPPPIKVGATVSMRTWRSAHND